MFPTDDEVEDLLEHMDTDGEGGIEEEEFLKHMAYQVWTQKCLVQVIILQSQNFRLKKSYT